MGHKRKPSPHQKQMRFMTFLFAAIMIAVLIAVMLLVNRPVGGYH
jgi:hypothetical protein